MTRQEGTKAPFGDRRIPIDSSLTEITKFVGYQGRTFGPGEPHGISGVYVPANLLNPAGWLNPA